jgi:hypothetical protein
LKSAGVLTTAEMLVIVLTTEIDVKPTDTRLATSDVREIDEDAMMLAGQNWMNWLHRWLSSYL